ncbi:MAG: AraC family transcriptional regulator ligand-binding domain-containing protein [Halioglobus sp.]
MGKPLNEYNVYVKHTVDVLRAQDIDVESLLQRHQISEAALGNEERQISQDQYSQLLDEVLRKYTVPGLGLLDGQGVNMLNHGVLGYAMYASANLGKAIERHTKYQDTIGAVVHTALFVDGDMAHLRVIETARPDLLNTEAKLHYEMERLFSQWAEMGPAIGRDQHWFDSLNFSYPAPKYRSMYQQILGKDVRFNCEFNQMNFPTKLLEQPLSFANEQAADLCDRQCAALLGELQETEGLVGEIRRLLTNTPGHYPSIKTTASHLALGERTLRRRLNDEGTSYKQVLLDYRMELAASYLRNDAMTVQEAAFTTGYSDPSNFHRTFSKYHGATPKQYRELHQAD